MNGDTIRIDWEGRLIDGQHRLRAILKSKVTIKMLIVENLPPDSFVTIDNGGRVRRCNDVLGIKGEVSTTALQGALYAIYRYERRDYPAVNLKPSTQELLEILEARPVIREIVKVTGRKHLLCGGPGVLVHFYGRSHAETLEQFVYGVNTGLGGLDANTGAYHLRERLIAQRGQRRTTTVGLIALTIKAFNSDVKGKVLRQLIWRADEDFPRFLP